MKLPVRPIIALVVIAAGGAYAYSLFSPDEESPVLTGYVEGDALYFAAPASGPLLRLNVERGTRVEAGTVLFELDGETVKAQHQQAEAGVAAANARAEDARIGQRPQELAVVEAQRDAAAAQRDDARTEFNRIAALVERGSLPEARRDQAATTLAVAEATLEQLSRQLESAQLGAREWEVVAADAEVESARAAASEVELRLAQLAPQAPVAGRIEDSFYQVGEWVPANQPVLALLPDEAVKIRFYVPETEVARYVPGEPISFSCDGCGDAREARISFVSPRAEFTPPVIYSRGSREKLVFLVEAEPTEPGRLAPGLPVDITPRGE
jgi:HlyD family secretion protein